MTLAHLRSELHVDGDALKVARCQIVCCSALRNNFKLNPPLHETSAGKHTTLCARSNNIRYRVNPIRF